MNFRDFPNYDWWRNSEQVKATFPLLFLVAIASLALFLTWRSVSDRVPIYTTLRGKIAVARKQFTVSLPVAESSPVSSKLVLINNISEHSHIGRPVRQILNFFVSQGCGNGFVVEAFDWGFCREIVRKQQRRYIRSVRRCKTEGWCCLAREDFQYCIGSGANSRAFTNVIDYYLAGRQWSVRPTKVDSRPRSLINAEVVTKILPLTSGYNSEDCCDSRIDHSSSKSPPGSTDYSSLYPDVNANGGGIAAILAMSCVVSGLVVTYKIWWKLYNRPDSWLYNVVLLFGASLLFVGVIIMFFVLFVDKANFFSEQTQFQYQFSQQPQFTFIHASFGGLRIGGALTTCLRSFRTFDILVSF